MGEQSGLRDMHSRASFFEKMSKFQEYSVAFLIDNNLLWNLEHDGQKSKHLVPRNFKIPAKKQYLIHIYKIQFGQFYVSLENAK